MASLEELTFAFLAEDIAQKLFFYQDAEQEPTESLIEAAHFFTHYSAFQQIKNTAMCSMIIRHNLKLLSEIEQDHLFLGMIQKRISQDSLSCSEHSIRIKSANNYDFLSISERGKLSHWSPGKMFFSSVATGVIDAVVYQNNVFYFSQHDEFVHYFSLDMPDIRSYAFFQREVASAQLINLFSCDNKHKFGISSSKGAVIFFDSEKKCYLEGVAGLGGLLSCSAINDDATLIVRALWDGSFLFSDLNQGTTVHLLPEGFKAKINHCFFLKRNKLILLDHLGNLYYWDTRIKTCQELITPAPVAHIFPVKLFNYGCVFIDRRDNLYFSCLIPSDKGHVVAENHLLGELIQEPTALCVTDQGYLVIGYKNGLITLDSRLVLLCSLSCYQIKLLTLLFAQKKNGCCKPLHSFWFDFYAAMPEEPILKELFTWHKNCSEAGMRQAMNAA